MSYEKRAKLIAKIEEMRGSKVICYLTSLRPGIPAQIADDQVRVIYDHLLALPTRPEKKIDIFLVSNGGSGAVPWRLTALLREFAEQFGVLIPYRAYSAATMLALGADEIVMHPFGEMGPIDPTVSNEFNPVEAGTHRRIGISVEDVKAYISFIKDSVGIRHEDELIKAVEILANKVHPLALGNVERFVSQSRMIARKILRTHMKDSDEHTIDEIVENLASKLYFHGHPINRREAREELKLKVIDPPTAKLEVAMWDLYLEYEAEFKNTERLRMIDELTAKSAGQVAAGQPPAPCSIEQKLLFAMIESGRLSSRFEPHKRYTIAAFDPNGNPLVREETISDGWGHQWGQQPPKLRRRSKS
jgi:hypothetical protein